MDWNDQYDLFKRDEDILRRFFEDRDAPYEVPRPTTAEQDELVRLVRDWRERERARYLAKLCDRTPTPDEAKAQHIRQRRQLARHPEILAWFDDNIRRCARLRWRLTAVPDFMPEVLD